MFRSIFRKFTVTATLTALVFAIGGAAAQPSNPPATPGVVTGTNPEPQVILTILLSTILTA